MGIGGRTSSVALAAMAAYLTSRGISALTMTKPFDFGGILAAFHLHGFAQFGQALAVAVICGLLGAAIIRFVRFFQEGLQLFRAHVWRRTLAGGILLCLVTLVHNPGHVPGAAIVEKVLWGQGTPHEVGLLIATQFLILASVLSGFGTIGVLWPTLALGSLLGFETHALLAGGIPAGGALPVSLSLVGGTAFWSALFGTPLAAAVAAYELSSNPEVLLPCFLAGMIALEIRRWLRTPALFDKDLEARGLSLLDGKSAKVLDALYVRDAMVTDHETVHEQEAVSELYSKILSSRYPFLPVVNSQGMYSGLLTIDMVQEAYQAAATQHKGGENRISLGKLLEAKDLLYRFRGKAPVIRSEERLSATAGMFGATPTIPVVSEDGKVLGLLFSYSVRLAYDREVARRSLATES
jgi:hypothetical protein